MQRYEAETNCPRRCGERMTPRRHSTSPGSVAQACGDWGGHSDHGGDERRGYAVPADIGDQKTGAGLADRKKLVKITPYLRHRLVGGGNLQVGDVGYAFGQNRKLQPSCDG